MKTKHQELRIRVTTDRAQFLASGTTDDVPILQGFNVSRDIRVRPQTRVRMYSRVTISENEATGTKAYLQYQPSGLCKSPMKLTLVPDDETGLQPSELWGVERAFRRLRPLNFEVTFEFNPISGVNRAYVKQHGRFGRSRAIRRKFDSLRYGSRKSEKMIRAYTKPQKGRFRIEVELHSSWLRCHGITRASDFQHLPALLVPKHFDFVDVDWDRLANYLRHASYDADDIIAQCRLREESLHRLTTYLRKHVGLVNTHRFLRRLPITRDIKRALVIWASAWVEPQERCAR